MMGQEVGQAEVEKTKMAVDDLGCLGIQVGRLEHGNHSQLGGGNYLDGHMFTHICGTGAGMIKGCTLAGTSMAFHVGWASQSMATGCEGIQRVTIPRKPDGSCMDFSDLCLRVR